MLLGITEVDGFAIAMIAILGLSFSFVAVILFVVIRSARRSNPEVDDLLDEVARDEPPQPAGDHRKDDQPSQPWEKQPDWWQKED